MPLRDDQRPSRSLVLLAGRHDGAGRARDPVFRAALAIPNQDFPGSGEFCIRCHSPRAWLEGRSSAPDASLLQDYDLNGVSCDVCHHLVDPLSAEARKLAKRVPPGYGNGMMVVDLEKQVRGPYVVTRRVPPPRTSARLAGRSRSSGSACGHSSSGRRGRSANSASCAPSTRSTWGASPLRSGGSASSPPTPGTSPTG